jgi:hypothetical protein
MEGGQMDGDSAEGEGGTEAEEPSRLAALRLCLRASIVYRDQNPRHAPAYSRRYAYSIMGHTIITITITITITNTITNTITITITMLLSFNRMLLLSYCLFILLHTLAGTAY